MSDNIVNLFEKQKEKELSVLERVENCTWHVMFREEAEAIECEYCKYRTAMAEKVFREVVSEVLDDAKKYNWELTTLDIKFLLAETIEKVMALEQEMVKEQNSGTESERKIYGIAGRKPEAEKASSPVEERTGETSESTITTGTPDS